MNKHERDHCKSHQARIKFHLGQPCVVRLCYYLCKDQAEESETDVDVQYHSLDMLLKFFT